MLVASFSIYIYILIVTYRRTTKVHNTPRHTYIYNACIYIHIYMLIYIHIHTCTHTYVHTHIYI